jgi:hypothetical protein
MSVYRAARQYNVPESTLRDRTRGNVDIEAKVGQDTIFTKDEEKDFVNHMTYMARIGYGYSKAKIQLVGRDYAQALGKNLRSGESLQLSNNWFYGMLKRWPELKLVKPQKLSMSRAKAASQENLNKYFKELSSLLTKHNLRNKPSRIFNVDETGIATEHSPPKVVCNKESKPQAITSFRSATVTIIAGGNATGNHIPPYYIFPGKRWNDAFLNDAAPGSDGEMSVTGWSNTAIFQNYITKHFANHAGITDRNDQQPTLILYDGHRSHISITLTDWAKKHKVLLFVLPPHSSHLTQPLDVGIFGPLKNIYNRECSTFMQKNPGMSITKYQVAALTYKPYIKAMSPENLISSFRKTGIFPFNNKVITNDQTAPSIIYTDVQEDENDTHTEEAENNQDENVTHTEEVENNQDKEQQAGEINFFETRTITFVVKKPKRKFIPPYLAGDLQKKSNLDILQSSAKKSKLKLTTPMSTKNPKKKTQPKVTKQKTQQTVTKKATNKHKGKEIEGKMQEPQPSTSGLNNKGGPIELSSEDSQLFSDVELTDDEDVCCVCNKWQPIELKDVEGVVFVKWGECSICGHWTHLAYCTEVTVLRRNSVFKCPHCSSE